MHQPLRLLVFQRIFFQYRKAFYDRVASQCQLTLVHGGDGMAGTASAPYSHAAARVPFGQAAFYFSRHLFSSPNDVVVLDFAIRVLNLPLLILYFRLRGKKVLLWSHGYDRKKGFDPRRSLGDRYRKLLIGWSHGLLVYGAADRSYLKEQGIGGNIFVLGNTLDSAGIGKVRAQNEGAEVTGYHDLVFMGRMTKQKEPSLLFRMFDALPERLKNTTRIHFIGDGDELPRCRAIAAAHAYKGNFIFHGALYDEMEAGRLLAAADLMIILGSAGLSVNHALLYGVPVVAFRKNADGPFHGPEEAHIIEGNTGFWVEKDDFEALAAVVAGYLDNKQTGIDMKRFIDIYAEANLSLESMVEAFFDAIDITANDNA